MRRQETLTGPDGLSIQLDADQIFPEDPGQGTPAIVIQRRGKRESTATFACANDTGVLEDHYGDFLVLNRYKCAWLGAMETYVDNWLTHFTNEMSSQRTPVPKVDELTRTATSG